MKLLSTLFIGSLLAIPAIGQISPESAIKELSIGTAQAVLSIVSFVTFSALVGFFKLWRMDLASAKEEAKESADTLRALVSANSVALSNNAQASHRTAKSLDKFSESVDRNTEVIMKGSRS